MVFSDTLFHLRPLSRRLQVFRQEDKEDPAADQIDNSTLDPDLQTIIDHWPTLPRDSNAGSLSYRPLPFDPIQGFYFEFIRDAFEEESLRRRNPNRQSI